MSSDLVEMLRVRADSLPIFDCEVSHAAADRIEELEAQVEGCLAVIATERAEVLALRRKLEEEREATWKLLETPYKLAFEVCQEKLAEAMEGFEDAMGVGMAYSYDRLGYDKAISLLNRLKGEQDDPT